MKRILFLCFSVGLCLILVDSIGYSDSSVEKGALAVGEYESFASSLVFHFDVAEVPAEVVMVRLEAYPQPGYTVIHFKSENVVFPRCRSPGNSAPKIC
tara:strand:+ start:483 stop:776 length:294 start_codon:yes stop_codon:yes gene_type:complete